MLKVVDSYGFESVEDKRNDENMDFVPSDCSIISIFNMESISDEQSPDVLFSL